MARRIVDAPLFGGQPEERPTKKKSSPARAVRKTTRPAIEVGAYVRPMTPKPPESAGVVDVRTKKVGEHRGAARVWLEGKWLARAGFSPGNSITVLMDPTNRRITVALNEAGNRVVSEHRGAPVIDLSSSLVSEAVGRVDEVLVETIHGKIAIRPKETHIAVEERRRERNALEGSVFSGAGFLTLAASQVGYTPAFGIERDETCADVFAVNHPSAVVLGDVVEAALMASRNRIALPHIDLLTAGIPCFAPGTMILTRSGYEQIELVKVGDEVLTHKGRWRRVTAVMKKASVKRLKIKAHGTPCLVTTAEHPFWAREYRRSVNLYKDQGTKKWVYGRMFMDPQWTEAKSLTKNHWLSQIVPEKVVDDDHTEQFWWLVGRYLADGWCTDRSDRKNLGAVRICCGYDEEFELASGIKAAGFHATPSRERTGIKFVINNKKLWEFLKQFGAYAHGKRLPGWVHELSPQKASALIDGYMSGDGFVERTITSSGREVRLRRASTASKALAFGVALLAQRALGVVASVRLRTPKPTTVIEGRVCRQRPAWIVEVPENNQSAFVEDGYGWKLIRSVEPVDGRGVVYNIAVDEDESYVAENAIVHNCQPYARYGRGERIAGGECKNDPELVSMAIWFAEIVKATNPFNIVIEQVEDFLETSMFVGLKGVLTLLGYHVQHAVLDATEFGLPTGRRRAVIVATTEPAPGLIDRAARSSRLIQPTAGDILLPPTAVEGRSASQGGWFTVRSSRELADMSREIAREEALAVGDARPGHWLGELWERGKFPPQFIDESTTRVRAIVSRYGQPDPSGPFVRHPRRPDTYRLLTVEEIKRLHGVPDDYELTGNYRTDVALLGQGVVVDVFRAVIRELPGGGPRRRNPPGDYVAAAVTAMSIESERILDGS